MDRNATDSPSAVIVRSLPLDANPIPEHDNTVFVVDFLLCRFCLFSLVTGTLPIVAVAHRMNECTKISALSAFSFGTGRAQAAIAACPDCGEVDSFSDAKCNQPLPFIQFGYILLRILFRI